MSAIFGESLTFPQEQGPDVQLVVFGDEFYARYETEAGYTVIYDRERGLFCYALVQNGEFVSSGVNLAESVPERLPMHLEESDSVRSSKVASRFMK